MTPVEVTPRLGRGLHMKRASDTWCATSLLWQLSAGVTAALLALVAAGMRGDMLFLLYILWRSYTGQTVPDSREDGILDAALRPYKLNGLLFWIIVSMSISFSILYSLGLIVQYWFYWRKRHQPLEWKCQPDRWLTPENERYEILLGSANIVLGSFLSSFLTCFINNGGWSSLYFNPLDRGWIWLVLSIPTVLVTGEAWAYYIHRALHFPILYRNIHKYHHKFHTPTMFSAVAMHPAEFLSLQLALVLNMFIIPAFAPIHICAYLYFYYFGLVDHSGVIASSWYPWQPNTFFHDDHHKYFHTNFGFNMYLFDYIHDTLRSQSRTYNEATFYGKGVIKDTTSEYPGAGKVTSNKNNSKKHIRSASDSVSDGSITPPILSKAGYIDGEDAGSTTPPVGVGEIDSTHVPLEVISHKVYKMQRIKTDSPDGPFVTPSSEQKRRSARLAGAMPQR